MIALGLLALLCVALPPVVGQIGGNSTPGKAALMKQQVMFESSR